MAPSRLGADGLEPARCCFGAKQSSRRSQTRRLLLVRGDSSGPGPPDARLALKAALRGCSADDALDLVAPQSSRGPKLV